MVRGQDRARSVWNRRARRAFEMARVPSRENRAMRWLTLVAVAVSGVSLMACAGSRPEPPQRIIYVAIGASDAAGVGADPISRGYVFRIADELDGRVDEIFLANLGLPGANAEQLDAALALFLESEIEPGLVTVWTGVNDVIQGRDVDDFGDDLEDILQRLRDRTDGVIAAANIPDLTQLPHFRADPDEDVTRERIDAFNQAIADRAADHEVLLVDLFGEPVEDELVSEQDGFHPNNGGHRRIAEEFLEVILPALGLDPTA
jgi:lysophospholipase L1-like esterase